MADVVGQMAAAAASPIVDEVGRTAVTNTSRDSDKGAIWIQNQNAQFKMYLELAEDPRTSKGNLSSFDNKVPVYVGPRHWAKHKFPKDYTNPAQLKFSNIKLPGGDFLLDMKWWIDYEVKINFKDFPWPVSNAATGKIDVDKADKNFLGAENVFCLRPYPLHQCTDTIHLRINNKPITSYPIKTLNPRMEYWCQDKFKDSCGFCPHRKMNCQTSYEFKANGGRSPFMNLGATYDGDFGNEVVIGDIIFNFDNTENAKPSEKYTVGEEQKFLPWKKCNGSITFRIREPVMAEPLDYFSTREGSRTMNNVTSIDLEYNFNNLRNMILFNRGVLYDLSKGKPLQAAYKGFKKDEGNWLNGLIEDNLESIMTVEINDAWLEIDVATPHEVTNAPFVTDYVEYVRHETTKGEVVLAKDIRNNKNQLYRIESDIYSLTYMPNAIYVWVAPNDATMYGSNMRCLLNNSYAQITKIEIDYGNLTNLCQTYEEKDFFLMSLRNGLEDRVYADWTRTPKCFYHPIPTYPDDVDPETLEKIFKNEYFGVGSVVRLIPGIDICSGGETTLIGGMRMANQMFRVKVNYRPLNMADDIQYSLFVAFEIMVSAQSLPTSVTLP